MAILTKAEAKKLVEMDDKMLDVLDLLKAKNVIDAKVHRTILLSGYFNLIDYLQQKKILTGSEAKQSIKVGFDYLLPLLAK